MVQQASNRIGGYRRDDAEVDPPYLYPDYKATRLRAPKKPLVILPHTLSEITGPAHGHEKVAPLDYDLTRQFEGEPLGERIIVHGRVLDGDGRPVRNSLVEIWQANAAGRYAHRGDRHPAPLDPNFAGAGRCLTNSEGWYRFLTIKPGAYPWGNHHNAWRPAHITQMYFPGDPLFDQDPIFQSVRDARARERLISSFDLETTEPEWALAYRFDIILRGRSATPMENH